MYEVCYNTTKPYGVITVHIESKVANDPSFRPKILDTVDVPDWLRILMQKCWNHVPDDRPSFDDIIAEIHQQAAST